MQNTKHELECVTYLYHFRLIPHYFLLISEFIYPYGIDFMYHTDFHVS